MREPRLYRVSAVAPAVEGRAGQLRESSPADTRAAGTSPETERSPGSYRAAGIPKASITFRNFLQLRSPGADSMLAQMRVEV